MKKIFVSIVLALGLVGAANAKSYVCDVYSSNVEGERTSLISGVSRYQHTESGEYRQFNGVKVEVAGDNTSFVITNPKTDKKIVSPKLKKVEGVNIDAYTANGKKFAIVYGEDGRPLIRYETDREMYAVMGCN